MESTLFPIEVLELAGQSEHVLAGGRDRFPLLSQAFAGIDQIGVIGWGPQGKAQAQNLRDTLAAVGAPVRVAVGLRRESPSWADAEACGFTESDGTLDDLTVVAATSDLVVLLIADAAQAACHDELFALMRPGAVLGLSHGFLLAHLQQQGRDFPDHISVIAVCPKGMGASVRRLYEQGATVGGAGINASVAVHQDLDGRAWDLALGWAVAIGAPYVFETTLSSEYHSDLVGERAALLGGPHAIAEACYRRFVELGDAPSVAFERAAESMTGPLARLISRGGIKAVADSFSGDDLRQFEDAYCAAYAAVAPVVEEIYDEVACGNEVRGVVLAGRRLASTPMPEIDGTRMWQVGRLAREQRSSEDVPVDPFTAALFCAAMMAQVDELASRGHPWSEIANESVIEAVDSLIPFMHARGVAYMVDNCSTTARLGARKWAPRFEAALTQQAFPALDSDAGPRDDDLLKAFWDHPVHDVLAAIAAYRPSIDISVP